MSRAWYMEASRAIMAECSMGRRRFAPPKEEGLRMTLVACLNRDRLPGRAGMTSPKNASMRRC